MSQMGLLAESLELDWTRGENSWTHIGGDWEIVDWTNGEFSLYWQNMLVLDHVELHTCVAHVLASAG